MRRLLLGLALAAGCSGGDDGGPYAFDPTTRFEVVVSGDDPDGALVGTGAAVTWQVKVHPATADEDHVGALQVEMGPAGAPVTLALGAAEQAGTVTVYEASDFVWHDLLEVSIADENGFPVVERFAIPAGPDWNVEVQPALLTPRTEHTVRWTAWGDPRTSVRVHVVNDGETAEHEVDGPDDGHEVIPADVFPVGLEVGAGATWTFEVTRTRTESPGHGVTVTSSLRRWVDLQGT